MLHIKFALAALVLVLVFAHSAQSQTVNNTQVTLSCNDGHSVIFDVDQITLSSLLADVQAINASGTGTSCTLTMAAIDPSSETTKWTVYDYNPSNQAIAPRNSPNSMPATTTGTTTTFQFKPGIYTALLTTTDPSLTGDLSAKTLTDTISVSGDAASFMTQHGGGDCASNVPAAVRFFFRSPSASGPSTGTPPAGFYTQFWWSNPVNVQLLTGNQSPTPSWRTCLTRVSGRIGMASVAAIPRSRRPSWRPHTKCRRLACHLAASASSKPASLPHRHLHQ